MNPILPDAATLVLFATLPTLAALSVIAARLTIRPPR